MSEVQKIKLNKLSDIQLEFTITSGNNVVINPNNKWITIYIRCGTKSLKVVNDPGGKETRYCHVEGDKLIVDIPGKKLDVGTIEYMIETRNNDENFNDKFKNIFSLNYSKTNIQLV